MPQADKDPFEDAGTNSEEPESMGPSTSKPKQVAINIPSLKDRKITFAEVVIGQTKESKVKVILTGGFIGMVRDRHNLLGPVPNAFARTVRKYPSMHDEKYWLNRFSGGAGKNVHVLPFCGGVRVMYTICEYDQQIPSNNITVKDWINIADEIRLSYEHYDGFVILHGTDTLAYTASALSFMLENLGKTVILTGSQIPMFEPRSDGKDNFTAALMIAGNYVIPEVCVVFGNKLMRGNRITKVSCSRLRALESPNFPPLAEIDVACEINKRLLYHSGKIGRFTVHQAMDVNVGLLRLFPMITKETVRAILAPPVKGVVLQSFGTGNLPTNRQEILKEISQATKRGVIIVHCSQVLDGMTYDTCESGLDVAELGLVRGYDMTTEAALAKLSYVLGKDAWKMEAKKETLQLNIRGELTPDILRTEEVNLMEAVSKSLGLSSPQEIEHLSNMLFPALVNSAVHAGDIKKITSLKSYGADLRALNPDSRSALHIACHDGNVAVVQFLLESGVSVHDRDSYDRTPLSDAIAVDNHDIIKLLVNGGAHLPATRREIGEQLCSAAARGSLVRFQSYELAGVNLGWQDPSGRTALHVAAAHGHKHIVEYLLSHLETVSAKDMLGLTALHYAKRMENKEIIDMIEAVI